MSSDTDNLVSVAQRQLDEHKEWLAAQIAEVDAGALKIGEMLLLAQQARQIQLRVVKASAHVVSVVWDYPDELHAWLSSTDAPKHLRDTLSGGHVVDVNQPASAAMRVHDDG